MARLTAVLGASTRRSTQPLSIEYRLVNLHRNEHITEAYLALNPKGQVPSMTIEGRLEPLTDSLDISYWFCEVYPTLLPVEHQKDIRDLLGELHSIEGLSLSARRPEQSQEDVIDPSCDSLLEKTDISNDYRQALEYKKKVDRSHMLTALHHDTIDRSEEQARVFLERVVTKSRFEPDGRLWLFGEDIGPTILDAHVVPFIARLVESGRKTLVPQDLLDYTQRIVKDDSTWFEVTHGRRTLWDISYGHVHLLEEI